MTRIDDFDKIELEDAAKCLDANYTHEKFEKDWQRFVKIKSYIMKRRANRQRAKSHH